MEQKTESDLLFEKFCRMNGIECRPVETSSVEGEKTPDYDILIAGYKILVEVKQMNPNPGEAQKQEELNKTGTTSIKSKPGHRVRGKIKDAMGKFKKRTENRHPSLLVLYDNVKYYKHTDPFEILSAMYGEPYFSVTYTDTTDRIEIGNMKLGGKQKMTKDTNTSISAIGVLKKESDGNPSLEIFHNIYAKSPLSSEVLSKIPVKQYTIDPTKSTELQEIRIS